MFRSSASPHWFGRRGRSAQESLRAQIFIDIRPVDAITCAAEFPVPTLVWGGIEKPWIPDQGNNNRASVHEVDRQSVLSEVNVLDALSGLNVRTLHSISPAAWFRFP